MVSKTQFGLGAALLSACFAWPVGAQTYAIATFAGGGLPVNIPGTTASLTGPQSAVAADGAGNLYFVDGNTVLKLNASTSTLTLVAGNGTAGYSGDGGLAVSAQLNNPYGLALDGAGNLYIADAGNNAIRMVAGGSGSAVITTIAGTGTPGFQGDNGPAASALLNSPYGLAVDGQGNIYFADSGNSRIRRISAGTITTIAGNGTAGFSGDNGPATNAEFNSPHGVATDSSGNVYVADTGNNRIRQISGGAIGTVAGNGTAGFSGDAGPATAAQLNVPCGVAVDSAGNLYIAEYYNNRIRKVSGSVISTVAGKGTQGFSGDSGPAASAQLNNPFAVAVDGSGNLFIADYGNDRIRRVSAGTIATVAGSGTSGFAGDNGSALSAQMSGPSGVALDSSGDVYVADLGNNRIRRVSGTGGSAAITTVAGSGNAGFSGDAGPSTSAQLNQPAGVAVDSAGNLYIADSGNNRVRKVTGLPGSPAITTVAGNGSAGSSGDGGAATSAELSQPMAVALDSTGNIYIADTGNSRVRKVAGTTITTIAGTGTPGFGGDKGAATAAQLRRPAGVAVDGSGNVYIADTGNHRIRKISGGTITTVAGSGTAGYSGDNGAATAAQLNAPAGVAANGTNIYVADTANNLIRRVSGAGTITTIAGGGSSLGDGGPATSGDLAAPQALAADGSGNFFVADTLDNRIRELTPIPLSIGGPASLPQGTVGSSYGPVAFSAIGGAGGYSWTATGLPKGLTLSAAGSLSGTPTATDTAAAQFTVKDSASATATVTLNLTVANPIPVIVFLSPASVVAYSSAFTLTVNGTGFLAASTILWNSAPLTTKFVSATQLTASVPASSIGGAGNVSITVNSSGTVSGSATLTITPQPPAITSASPASAVATGPSFTLTLTGSNFAQTNTVEWNGAALPTTFVSQTQLTAYVTAADIATAGSVSLTVDAGQVASNTLSFSVAAPPAITTLTPASVVAGGAAVTLKVTGTGFAQGAAVQWNGAAIATTFVSATQLTASVTAAQVRSVASVGVQVSLAGASSNSVTFAVVAPPTVTSLSPSSVNAGAAAFTLTVNGTGYSSGAAVLWNGTALTTTLVSPSVVTAAVTAAQVATAGSVNVAVSSGGATTSVLPLTINPPPVITTLNPATVAGSGAAFTLTVTGTGFLSTSTVNWGTTALTTTYVSATQLTAAVPANLAAGAGTASITVANPGGAASAASKLTLTAVAPSVAAGGVVPVYSSVATIQPGSWISIYGTGLASATTLWTGNYPTTLGGTSVTINKKPAYLWMVSPTQINLQAPNDTATGPVNVVVTTASGSSTATVTLAAVGPSFSLFPGSSYAAAVILTPDGSGAYGNGAYDLAGPAGQFSFHTRPVKQGDVVELFGVGFGPTNPAVVAGKTYTGAAPVTNTVTVSIGGVAAQVLFAGMVQSGVYQINIAVPAVASGDQPLLASVSGMQTPLHVLLTMQ